MSKKFSFLMIIILSFVFFTNKAAAATLRFNLYYQNGEIVWDYDSPERIQYFKDLYFVEPEGENNYEVVIQSFKGVILKTFKINLQPGLFYDYIDPETNKLRGGFQELTEGIIKVDLPYYPNASEARILDKTGKKIFSANLSTFAVCNENNACESNLKENEENCPTDCLKRFPWFLMIIISLVVLFLVITILIIKNYFRKK